VEKPPFYCDPMRAPDHRARRVPAPGRRARRRSRAPGRRLAVAALCLFAALAAVAQEPRRPAASPFARLVDADGRMPFPFEALVARLRERADPADPPTIAHVLVPFGRSLQRHTAAPAFLRHPRVLLAATGGSLDGEPLADRLYVAYQERADALELIGWSVEAGRFEFELVDDYRASGARRLSPAPRALCAECHGDGPVFAAQPWSETQASAALARRMEAFGARYHGFAVRYDPGMVDEFAASVNRAALVPVWQRIFRQGCGALGASRAAACRVAACEHALRSARDDGRAPPVDDAFADLVEAALATAWPGGLPVPDASVPDRDPLALAAGASEALRTAAAAAVAPESEASLPRPPRDRLTSAAARGVAARLAVGLGRAIPPAGLAGFGAAGVAIADRNACERAVGHAGGPFDGAAVVHSAISPPGASSAPDSP
jgi:hypothetical protein